MSESLRNDGRVWVPKTVEDAQAIQRGEKRAEDLPEEPSMVTYSRCMKKSLERTLTKPL